MQPRRARAIVTGRVQGVAFRASTADAARRLGVTGWVRNLPDGSVELEVEGDDERVTAMLDWCGYGPPHAKVLHVAVEERVATGAEITFTIRE